MEIELTIDLEFKQVSCWDWSTKGSQESAAGGQNAESNDERGSAEERKRDAKTEQPSSTWRLHMDVLHACPHTLYTLYVVICYFTQCYSYHSSSHSQNSSTQVRHTWWSLQLHHVGYVGLYIPLHKINVEDNKLNIPVVSYIILVCVGCYWLLIFSYMLTPCATVIVIIKQSKQLHWFCNALLM